MNGNETPITRRQAIAGIVGVGTTAIAGCSSSSGEGKSDNISSTNSATDDEPQQHEDPLAVAETNLKAAFETLNGITVIKDNEIVYVDTGQDPDFLDIHYKLDDVEAALETASEEYDSDTTRFTRLELGATLVEHKLTSYNLIDLIDSGAPMYTEAIRFVQLNGALGTIDGLFQDIEWVTESAHQSLDAIETLETHGIDPPEYYNVDQIAAESAVFAEFEDLMTPWLNGLQAWPNALLWASDGVREVTQASGSYGSAIDSYETAIDHVTDAQEYFDKRDDRPPVYREPISHATCRLPLLLDTYQTAKKSLEHRRDGDGGTAEQLLEEAHRLADTYREECHPGNVALVPPME